MPCGTAIATTAPVRGASRRKRVHPAIALAAAAALAPAGGMASSNADGWRAAQPRDEAALRDAVATGQESGLALYACRGRIGESVHIGRRRADFAACHVGYDGREIQLESHDLLTAVWRDASNGSVPPNSLNAGQEVEAPAEALLAAATLHPCRATHLRGLHIGQVRAGAAGCTFGFGGRQITAPVYEVLQAAPWMAWVSATPRTLAPGAIAGGFENGEPFYVCRAADKSGLRPGKVTRNSGGCNVVSGGNEVQAARFEVLVPRWVRASSGIMPVAALPGGRENDTVQYPCRAQAGGATQIGKASPSLQGCHIGVQGRETVVREFEVLGQ